MSTPLWSFTQIQKDLTSTDTLKQTDGATKVFDEWYKIAKMYAQGVATKDDILRCSSDFLYTATISNQPGKIFEVDMDKYVLSKLQSILCDFFNILQTKQKFQVLCQESKFSSICNWIVQFMITPFYQAILNDRVNVENRCEYMKTLTGLLNLGIFLTQQYPDTFATSPFSFDPSPLTTLVVNPLEDSRIRENGLLLLYSIHIIFTHQTLLAVCNTVRDRYILTWLWTTAILSQSPALTALKMRIKLLHNRDSYIYIQVVHSINDALPNIQKDLTTEDIQQLLSVVKICSPTNDIDDSSTSEYTSTYVSLMQAFLQYFPNNSDIHSFLLTTPLSLLSLSSIYSQTIDNYNNNTLYTYILPAISQKTLTFNPSGVSGDEGEQAIVDLLRDICTNYIEREKKDRDSNISRLLFLNSINCMRKGYIETERFPELCAKLLRLEYMSTSPLEPVPETSSLYWIHLIFTEKYYDTLRTRHAFKDMISLCISKNTGGISGQGKEESTSTSDSNNKNDPFVIQLFQILTHIRHRDMYYIWSDLLLEDKYILNPLHDQKAKNATVSQGTNTITASYFERNLLVSINEHIKCMTEKYDEFMDTYESILALCKSFSSTVSSCLSFLLFEVSLRTMYTANQLAPTHPQCDDDLLTAILQRFPREEDDLSEDIYYTSNDIIDVCIQMCRESTRRELAYLFPSKFLTDKSTMVRTTAFTCISSYPPLIIQNIQQDEDRHIGLGEQDLIEAAHLAIYHICVYKPLEYSRRCIQVLLRGLELTAENDSQNLPSSVLLSTLNDIASNIHILDLYRVVNQLDESDKKKLFDYSSLWKDFYDNYNVCPEKFVSKTGQQNMNEVQMYNNIIADYESNYKYMDAIRCLCGYRNQSNNMSDPSLASHLQQLLLNLASTSLPVRERNGYYILGNATLEQVKYWADIVAELQLYSLLQSYYVGQYQSAPIMVTANTNIAPSQPANYVNSAQLYANQINSNLFTRLSKNNVSFFW
ncbi:hypothetical protein WA158_006397 [Blastocystis sp. Blastoise]